MDDFAVQIYSQKTLEKTQKTQKTTEKKTASRLKIWSLFFFFFLSFWV